MRYPLFALLLLAVLPASAIRVFFDYRVFHAPGQGPYAEFVTSFEGSSMALQPQADGSFHSEAELTIILSQGTNVVDFRKVTVTGPSVAANAPADFISLERFMLANGIYDLEVTARDVFDPAGKPQVYKQKMEINNLSDGMFVSDIQFVSAYSPTVDDNAFSKSGMDIVPYITGYFPSEAQSLVFYAEIYHSDAYFGADAAFVSSVCITDVMNREWEDCRRMKREKGAPVVPMLHKLDISKLPTGEYKVKVEVRDRDNKVVCTKERTFVRNLVLAEDGKPADAEDPMALVPDAILDASWAVEYTHRDSLYALLQAHLPVAQNVERNTIDYQLKEAELRMLQSFFYTFWYRRNPDDPEAAWLNYKQQLTEVEKAFGTKIKKGWQTDRGRVYLQYGPPSTRVVRNHDPDYWPFEIWHYYETNNNLHDRRFLFYNTSLDTDLELLHSDVPTEVQNYDWKNLVRSRGMRDTITVTRGNNNQAQDPYSMDELEDLWYNPR